MLHLSLFELIFLVIPQSLVLIFSIIIFSFKEIKRDKVIFSGILSGLIVYLIRLLPIQAGIHTIILVPIYVLILMFIHKVPLIKAISSVILSILILLFSEMINIYFLTKMLNINVELAFENVVTKIFYGYISVVLQSTIVLIGYFTIYKKRLRLNNYKI